MQEHTLIQSKKFVESAPFDQVICSLHLLDGKDLFYESCYTEDNHTVYLNYLNTMIKLIKQHDFANILGHVDYICRYAPYTKKIFAMKNSMTLLILFGRQSLTKVLCLN